MSFPFAAKLTPVVSGAGMPGFGTSAMSEADSMCRTAGIVGPLMDARSFADIKKRCLPGRAGTGRQPRKSTRLLLATLSIGERVAEGRVRGLVTSDLGHGDYFIPDGGQGNG